MSTGEESQSLIAARLRLVAWAKDELHIGQSVRMHEPTYRNPAEIRRDVRETLNALDAAAVALQTCLHLLGEEGYLPDPDYPEVQEALDLYERIVGA